MAQQQPPAGNLSGHAHLTSDSINALPDTIPQHQHLLPPFAGSHVLAPAVGVNNTLPATLCSRQQYSGAQQQEQQQQQRAATQSIPAQHLVWPGDAFKLLVSPGAGGSFVDQQHWSSFSEQDVLQLPQEQLLAAMPQVPTVAAVGEQPAQYTTHQSAAAAVALLQSHQQTQSNQLLAQQAAFHHPLHTSHLQQPQQQQSTQQAQLQQSRQPVQGSQQEAAAAAAAAAGWIPPPAPPAPPPLPPHVQQQNDMLSIARSVAAAADGAMRQQFTVKPGESAECMIVSHTPECLVHTSNPTKPEEIMPYAAAASTTAQAAATFTPYSRLVFHSHLFPRGCSLVKVHQAKDYDAVNVSMAYGFGGPEAWPWSRLEHLTDGLSCLQISGKCTMTFESKQLQRRAAGSDHATDAAAPAASAAADDQQLDSQADQQIASSSKQKRKDKNPYVEVEVKKVLVLRDDEQHQSAVRTYQQQQQQMPGLYWRKAADGFSRVKNDKKRAAVERSKRNLKIVGDKWLACVGLNIFTGKELKRSPADFCLPTLMPVSIPPHEAATQQPEQHWLQSQQPNVGPNQDQPQQQPTHVSSGPGTLIGLPVSPDAAEPAAARILPGVVTQTPAGLRSPHQSAQAPEATAVQSAAAIEAVDTATTGLPVLQVQPNQVPPASSGLPVQPADQQQQDADFFRDLFAGNPSQDVPDILLQDDPNLATFLAEEFDEDDAFLLAQTARSPTQPLLQEREHGEASCPAVSAAAAAVPNVIAAAADTAAWGSLQKVEPAEVTGFESSLLEQCMAQDQARPPVMRSMQDLLDNFIKLEYGFLKLCAGMHGNQSILVAGPLQEQIRAHNWTVLQQQRPELWLSPTTMKERWFLQRSPFHLLMSEVRAWGPAGDLIPQGVLPSAQRTQLLRRVTDFAVEIDAAFHAALGIQSSGSTMTRLSQICNRNQATFWFTGCHFCILEALQFWISEPTLTWTDMLRWTKRGKLFYHIISTEYHCSQDPQRRQQLREGMRLTLAALADKLQQYLSSLTSQQIHEMKTNIQLKNQQRQQERQQQLRQNLRSPQGLQPQHVAGFQDPAQVCTSKAASGAFQAYGHLLQPYPSMAAPAGPSAGSAAGSSAGAIAVSSSGADQTSQMLQLPAVTHAQPGSFADSTSSQVVTGTPSTAISGVEINQPQAKRSRRCRWSDDVLWILNQYCLFHTSWSSLRSPPYHGQLLEEVAAELFGSDFKIRGPGV